MKKSKINLIFILTSIYKKCIIRILLFIRDFFKWINSVPILRRINQVPGSRRKNGASILRKINPARVLRRINFAPVLI